MFRLARTLKTPLLLRKSLVTVKPSRVITPSISYTWQQCQTFSHNSILFTSNKTTDKPADTTVEKKTIPFEEEDDLEVIDPKDFPELYPEESEDTEFDENNEKVDKDWFVDPEYADEKQLSETDFIPLWQRRAVGDHLEDRLALHQVSKDLMESGILTAETLQDLLVESKMDQVQIIDVREKCDWADYMIVASSGKGDKYLSGVAEHIGTVVKKAIQSNPDTLKLQQTPHIEGRNDKSGWLLIDLGRIIVHLFTPEMRERYDLEGLWRSVSTDPTQPMTIEEEDEFK